MPIPETTIDIGGRKFRIGATYAPRSGKGKPRKLRTLWWELAEVEWQHGPDDVWRICRFDTWLRWAGDEVAP
jgi:hypothetical protein